MSAIERFHCTNKIESYSYGETVFLIDDEKSRVLIPKTPMSEKIVTSILDGMIKMIIGNHSASSYIILHKGCYIKENPF